MREIRAVIPLCMKKFFNGVMTIMAGFVRSTSFVHGGMIMQEGINHRASQNQEIL